SGRTDADGSTAWCRRASGPSTSGWPSTSRRSGSGSIEWTATSRSSNRKENPVTPDRHGSSVVEYPSELEILTTREFDAPLQLVFDALTQPEHVRNWFAPFDDRVTECSIDLRVGGSYHIVFVTPDGKKCSFR